VLGSFCAGFLLIPWFGKEQSLSLVIGVQLITSLIMGGYLLWEKKVQMVRWIPLGVTAFLGLILCLHLPYWNRQSLSLGRYHRFRVFYSDLERSSWLEALWQGSKILANYQSNIELLYYGDGIGGFTTVIKQVDALGTAEYLLLNSGKSDASSRPDMFNQTLLAHLPLLFHPNPKEIMVLGLASGITAGEVLHYPIEKLDILEISQEVVTASNFFIPWNNKVLSHPKTELIIQDGRAHLELTKRKYDVIISEPSNPWMAGMASLFTREFFLLAKNRLKEDGIFVQWIHSYQMNWHTFALVGRTFSRVFSKSLLVTTNPSNDEYLMIGFKGGNRLMVNNADKKISYAQQSKNITLSNPRLLYRLIESEDLQKLFGSGPIHSDNWPRLEFAAPKRMYTDDPTIERDILSKRWLSQETKAILRDIADVEDQIAFATLAVSVYQPFYNMVDLSKATPEQKKRFFKIMEKFCTCKLITDYSIFTDHELRERCLSIQIETIKNNIHLVPDKTIAYYHLGNAYWRKGMRDEAISEYKRGIAINPNFVMLHNNLGVGYYYKGNYKLAILHFDKAVELGFSVNPKFLEFLKPHR
jgi:spermidine synthase